MSNSVLEKLIGTYTIESKLGSLEHGVATAIGLQATFLKDTRRP